MAKFSDYHASHEVADIMEGIIDRFPRVFPGFDLNKIGCVHSHGKKGKKNPIKLKAVRYPYDVWMSQTYIIEVADEGWKEMSPKKQQLAVFHTMCAIPEGGFDQQSDNYGKIRRPDYEMYAEEFAVSGGVPNWMDNDDARAPMDSDESVLDHRESSAPVEKKSKKDAKRVPVTPASLGPVPSSSDDEDDAGVPVDLEE